MSTHSIKQHKSHSQALDLLRFPLAIIIVTVHIFGRQLESFNIADAPILSFVISFINSFLRSQSVPIYFFISGYVFFIGLEKWDMSKWSNKLHNRKNSLLVPYLIWNTILLIAILITHWNNGINYSTSSILSCYWSYDGELSGVAPTGAPINYPLWFLRDLMVMVLITPVLFKLLKNKGELLLIFFSILWLVHFWGYIDFYVPASALFFFSFGAYMSINGKNVVSEFRKVSKISAIGFGLLGIVHMYLCSNSYYELAKIIKPFIVFSGLFFAFNTSAWLLEKSYVKTNKFLSSASFFIYITHSLILQSVYIVSWSIVHPNSDLIALSFYILNIVFTILISLLLFYLMSKYTPNLLSFIAGRKK